MNIAQPKNNVIPFPAKGRGKQQETPAIAPAAYDGLSAEEFAERLLQCVMDPNKDAQKLIWEYYSSELRKAFHEGRIATTERMLRLYPIIREINEETHLNRLVHESFMSGTAELEDQFAG